ncbi:MAG TPA: YqiA/YcfP family alpha/beta fold hydrolase [Thermoanaerobaculia bacterium]|nr:YqiA/YcfP family alpha/beta fold hydrolase [Thermoanaerobaculia bacterium]
MTSAAGRPAGTGRILYLHGFASSPVGRKVETLRQLLGPEGIEICAPDLNVPDFAHLDFDAMVSRARTEAEAATPDAIAGSSLGALVALAVAPAVPRAPLVLVAPALGFGRRWIEKLPAGDPVSFFHYGENRERPIHRRFFERMAALAVDRRPPAARVTLVMGTRDESVPLEGVEETWRRWTASGALARESRFVAIEGGDHGLTAHVPEIAAEIRRALS